MVDYEKIHPLSPLSYQSCSPEQQPDTTFLSPSTWQTPAG
jgi:hypothetical protein